MTEELDWHVDGYIKLIESIIGSAPPTFDRAGWFTRNLPKTSAMLALKHRWLECVDLPSELRGAAVRMERTFSRF